MVQDSSHRLKESIAKCAIELFRSEGYNNVSVNEICEAAHVSRSVFYTLFKGKRSILDYVVAKPQQNDEESFRKFADAENDFERIWQLFDPVHRDSGSTSDRSLRARCSSCSLSPRRAYAKPSTRWTICLRRSQKTAQSPASSRPRSRPELLSHIATDLIIHELYVWCSQNGNFCLRERARQYAEVAYHVKPQYRMSPEQRAAL